MKIIAKIILICLFVSSNKIVHAQQFLQEGLIEFEVKTNIKKTMGDNPFENMIKDKLPQFKTSYFRYSFSNNESIYQFHHWAENNKLPDFYRRNDEENKYYSNFNTNLFAASKYVFGTNFIISDTLPPIKWKLSNENREIAGFNCRKATGIIFDSVYVFAFYTDEIMISGGPASINGLPGMILGLTAPRLYTSWIATKVIVSDVNKAEIKPISSKKTYSINAMKTLLLDKTKDFNLGDDDKEKQKFIDQLIWNSLL
jgi:GLPGLI family protein